MERLVEAFEEEVRINFELGCKCRANVRLRSLSSTTTIAFKVQTSSPNKFLVNPPTGFIPPLSQTTFQVILKPQTQLPSSFPRSPADRFLIKTASIPPSPSSASLRDHNFINSYFSTTNLLTYDLKLKVAYVGFFLLRHAISVGDAHAARNIIKRQKSIVTELSAHDAEALLFVAVESSNSDNMISLLLEAGLKTEVRAKLESSKAVSPASTIGDALVSRLESTKGWTKIHVAAAYDKIEELERMIREHCEKDQGWLDCRDKEGRTPLHLAASRGNLFCARMLIEGGADKNAKSNDGRTALYRAAASGNSKMVALLMEIGADPSITEDVTCRSPLEIAKEKEYGEVIEILEQRERILTAARKGDLRALQMLLKRGAKANHCDQYGLTTLHAAAIKGHKDVVSVLIESGMDLDCRDKEGHTALHLAVEGGNIETIEVLINRGANVNAESKKGATPLYLARVMGYDDISQFLLRRGACSSSNMSPSSLSSML